MTVADRSWFTQDLGHRHRYRDDTTAVVELPVTEQLCAPGTGSPRASVLATVADIAAGSLVQPVMSPHVPLTTDLDVRRHDLESTGDLVASARAAKRGRTIWVLEVTFAPAAEPGRVVGASVVRFIRSPQPSEYFADALPEFSAAAGSIDRPFPEALRASVDGIGLASIPRWPYVLQPTGTIQGGAVSLVAELAAESCLGAPVLDIDVHFLSPVRVGPARAAGTVLWPGTARVDVRDEGNGGRLVATAVARAASLGRG